MLCVLACGILYVLHPLFLWMSSFLFLLILSPFLKLPPFSFLVSSVSLSFSIPVIGSLLFILFPDNFICILGCNYYIHANVYQCSTFSPPHSSLFNFSTFDRHIYNCDFNLHVTFAFWALYWVSQKLLMVFSRALFSALTTFYSKCYPSTIFSAPVFICYIVLMTSILGC